MHFPCRILYRVNFSALWPLFVLGFFSAVNYRVLLVILLTYLFWHIRSNMLSSLPAEMGELSLLSILDLHSNQVSPLFFQFFVIILWKTTFYDGTQHWLSPWFIVLLHSAFFPSPSSLVCSSNLQILLPHPYTWFLSSFLCSSFLSSSTSWLLVLFNLGKCQTPSSKE